MEVSCRRYNDQAQIAISISTGKQLAKQATWKHCVLRWGFVRQVDFVVELFLLVLFCKLVESLNISSVCGTSDAEGKQRNFRCFRRVFEERMPSPIQFAKFSQNFMRHRQSWYWCRCRMEVDNSFFSRALNQITWIRYANDVLFHNFHFDTISIPRSSCNWPINLIPFSAKNPFY